MGSERLKDLEASRQTRDKGFTCIMRKLMFIYFLASPQKVTKRSRQTRSCAALPGQHTTDSHYRYAHFIAVFSLSLYWLHHFWVCVAMVFFVFMAVGLLRCIPF